MNILPPMRPLDLSDPSDLPRFRAEAQARRAAYEAYRRDYRAWYLREHGEPDDVIAARRF